MTLKQKTEGCLLGLACGDAVGTTVEFCRRGSFPPVTDMLGGGKFRLIAGQWTDDTSMALCLADSLIEMNCFDAKDQMDRYWRWGNEGYNSSKSHAFGMGKTVLNALMQYRKTGNPYSGSKETKTSGNGSLMRIAPIAIRYHADLNKAIKYAELSSKTTHASTECTSSCQYFTALLIAAFQGGVNKLDILNDAEKIKLPQSMSHIFNRHFLTKSSDEIVGDGYVVNSLEAALWSFYSTNNFESAILAATNLGDDADTTAAICGQLAGAYYGINGIPKRWLNKVYLYDEIRLKVEHLRN